MAAPMLQIEGLRTSFVTRDGEVKAVDGVSLTLERGRILGLVGESGSGKSMLGYSIMGLVDKPGRIVGGRILFDGRDLTALPAGDMRRLRGKRISMIFQDPMMTLNPVLRVDTQMIESVLAHETVSREVARARACAALAMVGIPSPAERLTAYPHQFSGGMRQRVAIAIAMLHRPDLIIADEPTTALDVTIQAQIIAEVTKVVQERGTALIWITHDLSVVSRLADEVAVMYAGRILEHGSVEEVIDCPRHPYTAGLMASVPSRNRRGERLRQIPGAAPRLHRLPRGCVFYPRCSRADQACLAAPPMNVANTHAFRCVHPLDHSSERGIAADADETSAAPRPMPPPVGDPIGEPLIELQKASREFGDKPDFIGRLLAHAGLTKLRPVVKAVDAVNLTVRKGEVVGLVGESGCGKSTLGRMVAGLLRPSSGQVSWRGQAVHDLSTSQRKKAKLHIQMVFQNPFASLNPRMTVGEIVGEAPSIHGLTGTDRSAYVDEYLRRAGLDPELKTRYPHQFSGGQRQRIGIARALAVRPEFLVCDEAVAALDVSIQAQILNLFLDLREQLGLTYLFISHDLGVVEHLSDRVAIMYLGRIVEEASTEEVFRRPNHPYTIALLEEVPRIDTRKRRFHSLKGELPSPLNPPSGCHFHPRCPHAMPRCRSEAPVLRQIAPGHVSACHLNGVSP